MKAFVNLSYLGREPVGGILVSIEPESDEDEAQLELIRQHEIKLLDKSFIMMASAHRVESQDNDSHPVRYVFHLDGSYGNHPIEGDEPPEMP